MQIHEVSEVTTAIRNRKGLTKREATICDLIVEGLTSKQIAVRLSISHRTVDVHAQSILPKYGVHSRRELMRAILTGEATK